MRLGPLGLPEILILLFVYALPLALVLWFVISTVNFRKRMFEQLDEIRRRLEALERL